MAAPAQPVGSTKEVQGTLQQQGLYHGKLDGIPGPLTMDAVRSYQKAHQLPATGRLNTETMNNLNLH
jgi:peptidoglycan hydrolase-like protein with peptidoglycan-binding domain